MSGTSKPDLARVGTMQRTAEVRSCFLFGWQLRRPTVTSYRCKHLSSRGPVHAHATVDEYNSSHECYNNRFDYRHSYCICHAYCLIVNCTGHLCKASYSRKSNEFVMEITYRRETEYF